MPTIGVAPSDQPGNRWEQAQIELSERLRAVGSGQSKEDPLPLLWHIALAAANDSRVSRAVVLHRGARELFVNRTGLNRHEDYVASVRDAIGSYSASELAHSDRALAYHLSDTLGFSGLVPRLLTDAEAAFRTASDEWGVAAVFLDRAHILAMVAESHVVGSDEHHRGAESSLNALLEALGICERLGRFSVRLHAILHTHGQTLSERRPGDVLAALGRARLLAHAAASDHETEDGRNLSWGMPLPLDVLADAMPAVIDMAWVTTADTAASSEDLLLPAARYFASWVGDAASALASGEGPSDQSADYQVATELCFGRFFWYLLSLPLGQRRWGGLVRPAMRDNVRQAATVLVVASLERALGTANAGTITAVATAARQVLADIAANLGLNTNPYIVAYLQTLRYCDDCVAAGRPELVKRLLTGDATADHSAVAQAADRLAELGQTAQDEPHSVIEAFVIAARRRAGEPPDDSANEIIDNRLQTFVTPELERLRSQWDRADRADDHSEFADAYWLTGEVRDLAWAWLDMAMTTADGGGSLEAMIWNDVALWCHHAAVEAVWLARKAGLDVTPAVRSCRRILAAEAYRLGTRPQLLLEAQLVWLRHEDRISALDRPLLRQAISGSAESPEMADIRASLRLVHETLDPDEPIPPVDRIDAASGRPMGIAAFHNLLVGLRKAVEEERRPNHDELAKALVSLARRLCEVGYEKRVAATKLDRDGKPLRALRVMASMRDLVAEIADIDPQQHGLGPLTELQKTLDHLVFGYAVDTAMLAARENYRRHQELAAARRILTRHLVKGDWTLSAILMLMAASSRVYAERWRLEQFIDLLDGTNREVSAALRLQRDSPLTDELIRYGVSPHDIPAGTAPLDAARKLVSSKAEDPADVFADVLEKIDAGTFSVAAGDVGDRMLQAASMYSLLDPLARLANSLGLHEHAARLAAAARMLHPNPDDVAEGAHDLMESICLWNLGQRRKALDLADSGVRHLVVGAEKLRRPDAREEFLDSAYTVNYALAIAHEAAKDASLPDAPGRLLAMIEALDHDYTARILANHHQPVAWSTTDQLADRIGWLDPVPYPDSDHLLRTVSGRHVLAYRLTPDANRGFRVLVRPDGTSQSDEISLPDALLADLGDPPWPRLNNPDEIDRLTIESPQTLAELADLLLPPELQETPDSERRELLILLHGQLWHVPFAVLPLSGTPLIARWCPVLTSSLRAATAPYPHDRTVANPPAVGHIRDPYLAGAMAELRALESLAEQGRIALRKEQTARMATEACRDSDLLVISAHGEGTGSQYSLRLPDRSVTLAEIARWGRVPRDVLALTCLSGLRSTEPFPLGMVGVLHSLGAQTVVSGLWELPDAATARALGTVVENWISGTPIAEAVRATQQQMFDLGYPPSRWAGFITAR
jgi:hypothetical protein